MSRRKVRVPSDYAFLPRRRLVDLVTRLLAEGRALEQENEELPRAAMRQTARFSKGKKKGKHNKPGGKKGKGRFSRRLPPTPDEITDHRPGDGPGCRCLPELRGPGYRAQVGRGIQHGVARPAAQGTGSPLHRAHRSRCRPTPMRLRRSRKSNTRKQT